MSSSPRTCRRLANIHVFTSMVADPTAAVGAGTAPVVAYSVEELAATTVFDARNGGDPHAELSAAQLTHFMVEGYCVLPGILDENYNAACKADVDQIERDRIAAHQDKLPGPNNVSYENIGQLCSHPPTVRKVQQLMRAYGNGRDDCAMHHVNASRLDAGAGPAHWCARTHTLYSCSLLGAVLRVELMALCQAPRLPLRG